MLSSQSQVSAPTKIGSNSAISDTKIDETAAGLQSAVAKRLHSIKETNAAIIGEVKVLARKDETYYSDLAYRWAPIHYQYVNPRYIRRDMVSPINYDGD